MTGSSIYDYVLRERLAHALDAVLDSEGDLTAVALDVGFSSHGHFTARFAPSSAARRRLSGGAQGTRTPTVVQDRDSAAERHRLD